MVKNLSDDDFKYLPEEFSGGISKLVKQNGKYPYEYMDSFENLPDKYKFYSSLKDECISEKDYQIANNIWNVLKMNIMSDHHDLYLKTDVLLLADVFEKFINTCQKYYKLNPCYYFSIVGE